MVEFLVLLLIQIDFLWDVVFSKNNLMFIDGLPYEIDNDFGHDFLTFELNNFKVP